MNFTDICSFLEKSLFLQQLRPLTNPQQFQASVKYNVRIDRVKACGRGKGAVSLARSSLSLSSIGSMRLYRSCGNAFNSYSNGFITGDIFLQNDSPPLLPPPHSPPAHSHSCSDSHYALSTKLNFQPEPFKCLECWKWPWFYPLHKTAWRRTRRRKALFLNEISVMHSGALHALLIPLQSFCPLADRCQREAAAFFLWRKKKNHHPVP